MKQLYLLFVLLCLSGIAMAQPGPQFATASFTYERANCNSYQLTFHGNAAAIDTTDAIADYSWYFGSGDSTYHGKNVTFSYQAPGTYTVWLMVRTVKGDTASTFRYVNVHQDGTSLFASVVVDPGPGQENDSLFAYPRYSGTDSISYSYQWFRDDTLLQAQQSNFLTNYLLSGHYKVAVTNSLGCTSVSAPVSYLAAWDSVSAYFGWGTVACDPQFFGFRSYANPKGPDTLVTISQVWDFGDNHWATGAYAEHRYDSAGIYPVTLTVYVGESYQRSVTNYIEVYKDQQHWGIQITLDTAANGTKTLTAYPNPWYAKVVWNNGDSSYTLHVNKSGTYTAYVLDPCGNIKGADSIYVTVGDTLHAGHVSAPSLNVNVTKAFPNPSTGLVNLQFARPLLKKVVVSVYNQQGQVLLTRTTVQQSQQLDLSALPKGYYMIVISDGVTRKVQPLLLQ